MSVNRWEEIAERASKETDSVKLLELIHELNRLLGEREEQNRAVPKKKPASERFDARSSESVVPVSGVEPEFVA